MALRFALLDRANLRKLEPGRTLIEHGITAERLKSGDLRWTVNVMVDGQRIHRVIGKESAGVTRTTCEQFIERARSDARAERLSLPKGRKLHLTVAEAADNYIKRLEESGGKNIARKRRHFRAAASEHRSRPVTAGHLRSFFGSMRLDAVSSFTIGRYAKKRSGEGAANATINRELATLSHLFSMALEWKWIDRLPCRPELLEEGGGRIIALTDGQCDALMRAAIGSSDPYCWLFIAFGLNTAMRHGEILATRFDQADLDNLRLLIPDAKAGQRVQPITPQLAEILRKERETRDDQEGWIFPSPHEDSGTGHRARMDRPFAQAAGAAGLGKEITPHVMRHTAITALVKAGVDLPTIQRISGHKTYTMVLRYTHVHGAHIDRAIQAIGRALPELADRIGGRSTTQELPANNGERATTQELHRGHLRAVK